MNEKKKLYSSRWQQIQSDRKSGVQSNYDYLTPHNSFILLTLGIVMLQEKKYRQGVSSRIKEYQTNGEKERRRNY